ncbi:hypothetical protein MNBD_PLANCTO03-2436 [hydrothermal vent metagenome]|uniref:DUF2335 domain-containing protein n=1 Tax=hydrothermal vent metagenome TaxID=652676 RepID=A0A3B1DUY3_9ZZZZ
MSEPGEQTELDHTENPETVSQDVQGVPAEVADVMREMPPQFRELMASFTMGPPPNPIMSKINEEHISKALDLAEQAIDNNYKLDNREVDIKSSNRGFALAVFGACLGVIVVLVLVLQDKPEVLLPTLSGLFGLAAGALGGYGYGKSKADS